LEPMLGVVGVSEYQSFVMADIPGIIEGAHMGKGLGHQFLRHIQRTSMLLFLIDIATEDPVEAYRTLRAELYLYDSFMDKKPHLVVISKSDTISEEELAPRLKEITKAFKQHFKEEVMAISSVGQSHLEDLKYKVYGILQQNK